MYTNMSADSTSVPIQDTEEPKSAVEYLENTVNFDTGEITKNTCVVETRDDDDDDDDVYEGGVDVDMISLNDLVVLVVLYHGRIDNNIESRSVRHPVIRSTDFPHITNLGNITFAPTAMVNVGSVYELNTRAIEISNKIQEGFKLQIDDITRKADEIIIPSTDLRSKTSKFCDYCIDFAYKTYDGVTEVVSGLYGYTFQGILRVCRSKLFPMSGGVFPGVGNKRKRPAAVDYKMSTDLCVVIFDSVRRSIQETECKNFPAVCNSVSPPIELCTVAGRTADSRCRVLNAIKGFGVGEFLPFVDGEFLPFVDKYLAYSSVADAPLHMGVVKLTPIVDSNGNVSFEREDYNPLELMRRINYIVVNDGTTTDQTGQPQQVFWSSMKRCIEYCTTHNNKFVAKPAPKNLTVFNFDLTCSSMSCVISVPLKLNSIVNTLRAQIPGGGGGVIKKNKSSRKRIRTRKIKNRSTNVKYLRNRRNVKNLKRKTKKVRRTYRR